MRLACGLAYEGTKYAGWQSQISVPTVQDAVEVAIGKVATHRVKIIGAGRTDSGVHAANQVIHFDTHCIRLEATWVKAINYYLPSDIQLLWAKNVPNSFHARFSASQRTYCYSIYQGSLPWFRKYSWQLLHPLNIDAMRQAAAYLIGEHDFSAFRAAACQAHSPVRCVSKLNIIGTPPWIVLEITANAFLHHMVRNIVGVLVDVGKGYQSVESILALLKNRDRRQASITAPPQGLYFHQVSYPDAFGLPILCKDYAFGSYQPYLAKL
jgi:tRNA pseudouridine38-40 synthase